jgi:hypothetical protein
LIGESGQQRKRCERRGPVAHGETPPIAKGEAGRVNRRNATPPDRALVVERLFVSVHLEPNLLRMFGPSHRMTLRAEVVMDERVCTGPGIGNKPAAGQVHDAVAAQAIRDPAAQFLVFLLFPKKDEEERLLTSISQRHLALHVAWPATGPGCFLHALSKKLARQDIPLVLDGLQKVRRLARQVNVKKRARCGMHQCSMAASDGRLAGQSPPIYVRQEENRRAGVE